MWTASLVDELPWLLAVANVCGRSLQLNPVSNLHSKRIFQMKSLILAGLSTLALVAVHVPAAQAEVAILNPPTSTTETSISQLSPFELVNLAYQGFLSSEGVPVAGGLIAQYQTGSLTAEDLVQAAINTNRLSSEALDDSRYLRAVDTWLGDLSTSGS
jgi:hypothetical protein